MMTTIKLMLPQRLYERVEKLAMRNNVPIDLFVATAVAEKVSALLSEEHLTERIEKRQESQT